MYMYIYIYSPLIKHLTLFIASFHSYQCGWWFGTMEFIMTFHSVENVITPTDELTPSFVRGVGFTTNQI